MPSKPRAPEADSKDGKQPMKWWQWFIVYPTVATSFFAAIPTATNYAKSLALGVKPSQVSDAETQNKLWEKNADCLINAKGLSIKTPQAFEVGPDGIANVLVRETDDPEVVEAAGTCPMGAITVEAVEAAA